MALRFMAIALLVTVGLGTRAGAIVTVELSPQANSPAVGPRLTTTDSGRSFDAV